MSMSTNLSDDFIVAFGKNLKRLRVENGLRHQDMDDYGITRAYYGKIELGKHCATLDKIYLIAKAFGTTPDKLFLNKDGEPI